MSWKLPQVYLTTNFEQNLGGTYFYALGNVGDGARINLMPGDALNSSGNHILLFDRYNTDGTIQSMEQAPWHARRRTWTWSNLLNYRPLRRELLVGGPSVNAQFKTTTETELRSCPGFTCGNVLWTASLGAQGTIIGGPQKIDKFRWWQVRFDEYDQSGWVTEGYLDTTFSPSTTCGDETDHYPPAGVLKINSDTDYSNLRDVMLETSCTDLLSGCALMRLSNDNIQWLPWEAYAKNKKWTLSSGDGNKTVYAQFADSCGNASEIITDSIVFQSLNPDLQITNLSAPVTACAGGLIPISDTTLNKGLGGANKSQTTFFLQIRTPNAFEDRLIGSRLVPSLQPGSSSTGTTTITLPSGLSSGKYTILTKADGEIIDSIYMYGTGAIFEASESNNTKTATIKIGPDLIVSTVSAPLTGGAGLGLKISDTTANNGCDVLAESYTEFFLSTKTTLDASAVFLGRRLIPVLTPGTSSNGSTIVNIPSGISIGKYYLIAKADNTNVVAESDESNNTKYVTITIGPDLVVSALTVPVTSMAGASVNVVDTTRNSGGGSSGVSSTGFYLSSDNILDSTDVFLNSRSASALDPGSISIVTTPLIIPGGTPPGKYFILSKADDSNIVQETIESNNTRSAAISIGPDLTISYLVAPASVVGGASLSITDTTRNAGGASASTSSTGYYLSTNTSLDPLDLFLGSRIVPILGPGATHSTKTSIVIPAGTSPGPYFLITQADDSKVIVESNEANNIKYLPIAVQ
jgi:subtilase family serine protease